MSTRADDLTPRFAAMRAKLADAFHADSYEVVRTTQVPDGYGGTTSTESVVETGRCTLDVTGRGTEAVTGGVATSASPYTAELPIDSAVSEEDTLRVNGREFAVISVAQGGKHDLFTIVGLEERG